MSTLLRRKALLDWYGWTLVFQTLCVHHQYCATRMAHLGMVFPGNNAPGAAASAASSAAAASQSAEAAAQASKLAVGSAAKTANAASAAAQAAALVCPVASRAQMSWSASVCADMSLRCLCHVTLRWAQLVAD